MWRPGRHHGCSSVTLHLIWRLSSTEPGDTASAQLVGQTESGIQLSEPLPWVRFLLLVLTFMEGLGLRTEVNYLPRLLSCTRCHLTCAKFPWEDCSRPENYFQNSRKSTFAHIKFLTDRREALRVSNLSFISIEVIRFHSSRIINCIIRSVLT